MKPNEAAVLHLAAGALKPAEVPVGHHDLSRVQLILTFPAFCAVSRAAGTNGDGTDAGAIAEPKLTAAAMCLFLDRVRMYLPRALGLKTTEDLGPLWADCIREAARGGVADPPLEALAALARIHDELRPVAAPRRTPAKRIGAGEVTAGIKRLPRAIRNP